MKTLIFFTLLILIFIVSCSSPTTPPVTEIVEPNEEEHEDNMYMVSHSEYWSGEEGQVIARLLNWRGQPISANCSVDIQYPNKTYFIQNETMTLSVDSYYYNFTTPEIEGVYEYKATCQYSALSRSVMNSFHVSPALNFIQISHDNISNQIVDLTNLNNAHFGNITYNLTQIKEDTDYIRSNLQTNASTTEILTQLDEIANFCGSNVTSDSYLCLWVNETRNRLINMNASVDNYLQVINQTTDTSAGVIVSINETVSGLGQFTQDDRNTLNSINKTVNDLNLTVSTIGSFTDNDRLMLEKIYNCTILGQGCYFNEERVWNYSGRYIHGELI